MCVRARKEPIEWPKRKYGTSGHFSAVRQRSVSMSAVTLYQPSSIAKKPTYSGPSTLSPWPRWSLPTTTKPFEARKRAKSA